MLKFDCVLRRSGSGYLFVVVNSLNGDTLSFGSIQEYHKFSISQSVPVSSTWIIEPDVLPFMQAHWTAEIRKYFS